MDIRKTATLYNKVSIWILCFLTLVGLVVMRQMDMMQGFMALVVSVVFNLVCSLAYVQAWKAIARRSPESLPKLYLASSAFRLMAAAMVLLVYCVVKRSDVTAIKYFAVVFIIYYLVMLVYDAIFFARVSKNSGFRHS